MMDRANDGALCALDYPHMPAGRVACVRPHGHHGAHWAPMFASATKYLLWHWQPVTVLRQILPTDRLHAARGAHDAKARLAFLMAGGVDLDARREELELHTFFGDHGKRRR